MSAGEEKGVGMCVGPIFSETPTLLDWLQYYADLGVAGIHMYASVAEFILGRNDYMHLPGSHRSVQFQAHHLVTWRAFHPSRWSQHYYGQVGTAAYSGIQPHLSKASSEGSLVLCMQQSPWLGRGSAGHQI